MIDLILFCMAVIGLTCIILESSIFAPVRAVLQKILPAKVYEVFECHQCMGTWAGFFVGYFLLANNSWIVVLLCGFAGSFLSASYHRLFVLLEEFVLSQTQIDINVNDNE